MSPVVVVSTAAAQAALGETAPLEAKESCLTNGTKSATSSQASPPKQQQQVNTLSSSSAFTGLLPELTNINYLKEIDTEQHQQQPLALTASSGLLIGNDTDSPRSHDSAEHRDETKVEWKSSVSLQCVCKHDQCMHKLTCAHLEARQFWFFTIPQALVTMLGGLLAFLCAADKFTCGTDRSVEMAVGSFAVVSVFMQTVERVSVGENDIANRKNDNSNNISYNSPSMIKDTEGNQGGKTNKTNTSESQCIELRYQQSSQGCKSFVELSISEAFELLHTELMVTLDKNSMQHFEDKVGSDWYLNLYLGACDRLCAEITSYSYWPLFVPNSNRVVSNTMKLIQRDWKEGENFWLKEI
ncbi:hypothetical protein FRACYDRAFT_249618 [Fragilariopsis cylindrus CCMP1102]|uniref:Uncharacterized protein n=1 Tax=Fragilariopsis cylindrus CCMP1102 TaxID=635003 RepID=A0A1E7ES96_9STRA|nr:hypothetical protein FRACYDRAFT_249618 [Fragilariopsis cylindrus CCMP1102]|eukprot:OEU08717.1 hypothetical protein FRACYDRAFT_249618 [Fragilariopsis cylindrus CCMP1102]